MDQTVPAPQTVVFVCVGQGYGIVNVSWHGNKINKSQQKRSNVTTVVTPDLITSTLTISNLKGRDSGRYRCRYSNSEGGTFSNFATLTVGCK